MNNDLNDINKARYNHLETDYKAEVVAVELLKNQISLNRIFVKRLGNNDRAFNKDVRKLENKFFDLDKDAVTIETYKEGMYDYLPEGFFHPPNLGSMKHGVDSIVHEMRKQKDAENNARAFFQPFEQESYYTQLNALIHENNLDLSSESNHFLEVIAELWPLLNDLEPDTAKIFLKLMPFLHSVRGNKVWFERCLSAFLRMPVEITFEKNILDGEDIDESLLVSHMQLGISSILCGAHADGERNWVVNIGPIPASELSKFVPGSPFRHLLQSFYEYCLPASISVREYFVTEKEQYGFILTHDKRAENYLGFSTFL